jgi:Glyoxalase/Bleomycin resistance protein/Dioxygenase superfamily
MAEFPAMSHVAVTVTDLAVSVPWYERLLGAKPVLDEDAGGFHHTVHLLPGGTLLGLHQHPATDRDDRFDEHRPGLDHLSSGSSTALSSRCGRPGSRSSGFPTERSLMPTTARGCLSATPTTSPWSCSRRPDRSNDGPPAGTTDQLGPPVLRTHRLRQPGGEAEQLNGERR